MVVAKRRGVFSHTHPIGHSGDGKKLFSYTGKDRPTHRGGMAAAVAKLVDSFVSVSGCVRLGTTARLVPKTEPVVEPESPQRFGFEQFLKPPVGLPHSNSRPNTFGSTKKLKH